MQSSKPLLQTQYPPLDFKVVQGHFRQSELMKTLTTLTTLIFLILVRNKLHPSAVLPKLYCCLIALWRSDISHVAVQRGRGCCFWPFPGLYVCPLK